MSKNICWIRNENTVDEVLTAEMRAEICREDGTLHRLYQSLLAWPPAMLPADRFYRAVLHSDDSPLGLYKSEFIATYVAILAECTYARAHHGENFLNTASTRDRGKTILAALERDDLTADVIDADMQAMAAYTKKLSLHPADMNEGDIEKLRMAGLSEAQIVQTNQVAASFGYWVRMINGLGIHLGEEEIGIKPKNLNRIVDRQSRSSGGLTGK